MRGNADGWAEAPGKSVVWSPAAQHEAGVWGKREKIKQNSTLSLGNYRILTASQEAEMLEIPDFHIAGMWTCYRT
jgi:hypothetical protein